MAIIKKTRFCDPLPLSLSLSLSCSLAAAPPPTAAKKKKEKSADRAVRAFLCLFEISLFTEQD
jgi:hypothetical protein